MKLKFYILIILLLVCVFTINAQTKSNVVIEVATVTDISNPVFINSKPLILCRENDTLYRWNYTLNQYRPLGEKGDTGAKGDKGDTGNTGATGATGSQGSQGSQGAKGDTGNQGNQGTQGLQGLQGIQGIAGTNGTNGTNGTTPSNADLLTLFSANNYRKVLSIQQTQNLPLIAINSSYSFTVTITGAVIGNVCVVNIDGATADLMADYDCRITATNTATVRLRALLLVAAGNRIFDIKIIQ